MREQTKEKKKSQADARRLSGSAYNLLLSLDPLYYSVVSDAQCEKEREKERKKTVLTLLVEALSHMSQSHSLTLSPSLSLSSNPSINYLRQRDSTPHHSIAILEKTKTRPLTRYQKRTVLFFFSSKSETCTPRLAADPRYLWLYCM